MFDAIPIFQFITVNQEHGRRLVLVTIAGVSGGSTRNPGTHMAVCEDGTFAGTLSGGCIEQAVVSEALETLTDGMPRMVRYGAGSPYIDIRLPCGGWIDVHYMPLANSAFGREVLTLLEQRSPCRLIVDKAQPNAECAIGNNKTSLVEHDNHYKIDHTPSLTLAIVGSGDAVFALARLADQICINVEVATPDGDLHDRVQAAGIACKRLNRLDERVFESADHWTAIAILFHDHDWEPPLMHEALNTDAFYIGAMGSKKTHEQRKERLAAEGFSPEKIEAISAPIGLIHSLRDPETLAVSVLAQIVDCYNETYLR